MRVGGCLWRWSHRGFCGVGGYLKLEVVFSSVELFGKANFGYGLSKPGGISMVYFSHMISIPILIQYTHKTSH